MADNESEQFHDDFEVEISSLDEPGEAAGSSRLPSPLRKLRLTRRRRRFYLLLLNTLLILAFVLLLVTTASIRELVGSVFIRPTPTSTPTLAPGVDLFYVAASPPWGQLSVDGRSLVLPTIGIDPPLRFARGQHQLAWQAAPFLPQRCTVSVPPALEDTCNYHETTVASSGLLAWVITFSESLVNLAGSSRAALLQAAQATLDARQSTDTVRPGEHYVLATNDPACSNRKNVRGYQCYATTRQPLKARLRFQLDTNENSNETCIELQQGDCTLNNQDCRLFCGSSFPTSSATREWDAFAPVLSLWTFATMDGHVLARDVPDDSAQDFATGLAVDESLAPLDITWDSAGWHVTLPANLGSQGSVYQNNGYFNPVCAAMTQQIETIPPPEDANGEQLTWQWSFISGKLPAAGCLAVSTPRPEDGITPTPSHTPPPVFYCLERFGVLLLVNKPARNTGISVLFDLPFANVYEQQLARELLTQASG